MTIKGVMTTRDMNRTGGVTGAARMQQIREKEKKTLEIRQEEEQIALSKLKAEKEEKEKKKLIRKMIKEEIVKADA